MAFSSTTSSETYQAPDIRDALKERILVIDGAMGTMIQQYGLVEADYRGERFHDHITDLKNNNEALMLVRPDIIEAVHTAYLEAGADIVETNTFNATRISLADFGMEDLAHEMNVTAAQIARRAVEKVVAADPLRKPRWVAGALGPQTRSASVIVDADNPAVRGVNFDQLREAYREQAQALLDGGVDVLLCETTFDTLNLKAALFAIEELFAEGARVVPVMASLTITDLAGGNLSGPKSGSDVELDFARAAFVGWPELRARAAGNAAFYRRTVGHRAGFCVRVSERGLARSAVADRLS